MVAADSCHSCGAGNLFLGGSQFHDFQIARCKKVPKTESRTWRFDQRRFLFFHFSSLHVLRIPPVRQTLSLVPRTKRRQLTHPKPSRVLSITSQSSFFFHSTTVNTHIRRRKFASPRKNGRKFDVWNSNGKQCHH